VLSKLKLKYSVISEALISCDEKILTLPNLESLDVICPNEEEISSVKGYDGDLGLLANPEKFIVEIIKVKGFPFRIKGLKFICVYEDLFKDLNQKVATFQKIFDDL